MRAATTPASLLWPRIETSPYVSSIRVSRQGALGLIGESLMDFRRVNHRMHNKTWIADNYNLDPRSAWLNCEQGVLVESETLAREMAEIFARQISGQRAWRVTLASGKLRDFLDGPALIRRAAVAGVDRPNAAPGRATLDMAPSYGASRGSAAPPPSRRAGGGHEPGRASA
jgi:hypothetical protein